MSINNDFDFFKNIKLSKDEEKEEYQDFTDDIVNDMEYDETVFNQQKKEDEFHKNYTNYEDINNNDENIFNQPNQNTSSNKQDNKEEKINLNDDKTIYTNFNAFKNNGEGGYEQIDSEATRKNINTQSNKTFKEFLSVNDDLMAKKFSNLFHRFSANSRELKNCYTNQKSMNQHMADSQYSQNQIEQCFQKFLDKTKKNIKDSDKEMHKALKDFALFPPLQMALFMLYFLKKSYHENQKNNMEVANWIKYKQLEHFLSLTPDEQKKYVDELEKDLKGHTDKVYESMNDFKEEEKKELNNNIDDTIKENSEGEVNNLNEAVEKDYFNQDISKDKKDNYEKEFGEKYNEKIKNMEDEIQKQEKELEELKLNQYENSNLSKKIVDNKTTTDLSQNAMINKINLNDSIVNSINFDDDTKKDLEKYIEEKNKAIYSSQYSNKFIYKPNDVTTMYDEVSKNYEKVVEKTNFSNVNKEEMFKRIDLEINSINDDFIKNNKLYTQNELTNKLKQNLSDIEFFKDENNINNLANNIIQKQSQLAGEVKESYNRTIDLNKKVDNLEHKLQLNKERLECFKEKKVTLDSGVVKDNKSSINYELSDTLSKISMDKHNRDNINLAGKFAEEYLKNVSSKENVEKSTKQILEKITNNINFNNALEKEKFEKIISKPLNHFHNQALKNGDMNFLKLENQLEYAIGQKHNQINTIKGYEKDTKEMILNAINDELTSNRNGYILKNERQNIQNAAETLKAKNFFDNELKYANNTNELRKLNQEIYKAEQYFEKQSNYLRNTNNRSLVEKTSNKINDNINDILDSKLKEKFNPDIFRSKFKEEIDDYVNNVRNSPNKFNRTMNKRDAYHTALAKATLKASGLNDEQIEKKIDNEHTNLLEITKKKIAQSNMNYSNLTSTDIFTSQKLVENAKKLNQMLSVRENCSKNENTYKTIFKNLQKGNAQHFTKIVDIAENPTAGLTKSVGQFLGMIYHTSLYNFKNGKFEPSFENIEKSLFKNKVLNKIALSEMLHKDINKNINSIRSDTISSDYVKDFKNQNSHIEYKKGRTINKNIDLKNLKKSFLLNKISKTNNNILNYVAVDIDENRNFVINSKEIAKNLYGDKKNILGVIKNCGGLKNVPIDKLGSFKSLSLSNNLTKHLVVMQKELKNKEKFINHKDFKGLEDLELARNFFNRQKNNKSEYVFSKHNNFGKLEIFTKKGISELSNNLKKAEEHKRIMKISSAIASGGIKGAIAKSILKSAEKFIKEGDGAIDNLKIIGKSSPSTNEITQKTIKLAGDIKKQFKKIEEQIVNNMNLMGGGEPKDAMSSTTETISNLGKHIKQATNNVAKSVSNKLMKR